MSKIKIAELFYSIQGEGRYMGVPSVFLRTFGCNFKCAGFGMPRGEMSHEATDIAATHTMIESFQTYDELPLVSTGCDSYASWMPEFKDLSPMLTADAIAERIMEILPYKRWEDETSSYHRRRAIVGMATCLSRFVESSEYGRS
jgi:organic radical activating enzyme